MKKLIVLVGLALLAVMPSVSSAQQDMERPLILRKATPNPTPEKCAVIEGYDERGNLRYRANASDKAVQIIKSEDIAYAFKPRKDCPELLAFDKAIEDGKMVEAAAMVSKINKYTRLGWDANIYYMAGMAFYATGKKEDAIKILTRLLDVDVTGAAAWKQADVNAGLSHLAIFAAELKKKDIVAKVAEFVKKTNSAAQQGILIAEGDIAVQENRLRDAAFKYMEAAYFYDDAELTPRALCFVANTMKRMGDARGSRFADKLNAEYPTSPWKNKLK